MRILRFIPAAALVLALSGPAHAATWIEFTNQEDHFGVSLPAQPTRSDMEWESEYGETLPAHKYVVTEGGITYTVIVVDYTKAMSLNDVRGSMEYAAAKMRKTGKVTFDAYEEIDRIPGIQVQVTLANKKRVFAGYNLYNRRLYQLIAEAPADAPPPEGFRASLTVLNDQGNAIRLDDDGKPLQRGGPAAGGAGGAGGAPGAAGGGRGAGGGGGRGAGGGGGAAAAGGAAPGNGDGY